MSDSETVIFLAAESMVKDEDAGGVLPSTMSVSCSVDVHKTGSVLVSPTSITIGVVFLME